MAGLPDHDHAARAAVEPDRAPSLDDRPHVLDQMLALAEHVDPQPDSLLLRVLVRDVATGALGSLTIPLKTRALR